MLPEIIILGLATWRLTSLLTNEEGPWKIFEKLRLATDSLWGLLDCPWCTSVWVAAAWVVFIECGLVWKIPAWLSISAVSIIIDSAIGFFEGNEVSHG